MTLKVVDVPTISTPFAFTFAVPGNERWTLRSVRADVARVVGGAPNRAYSLTVSDGTNIVAQAGADDAGAEPGTTSVTWCDCPSAKVAAGNDGVVVAPLPNLAIEPGYLIVGTILNPAGADAWLDAIVWLDYLNTTPS